MPVIHWDFDFNAAWDIEKTFIWAVDQKATQLNPSSSNTIRLIGLLCETNGNWKLKVAAINRKIIL